MTRSLPLVLFAAVVACAPPAPPSGTLSTGRTHEETRLDSPQGVVDIVIDPNQSLSSDTLAAGLARAWEMLPKAYFALGIPVQTVDSRVHLLGNTSLTLRRQLAGTRLSRYLTCGNVAGMPNADTYSVTLRIVTELVPADSNSTHVRSQVSASAHPEGVVSNQIRCETTGRLEERIFQELLKHAMSG